MKSSFVASVLILAQFTCNAATTKEIRTPVQSVLIYPSAAQLNYSANVSLVAGEQMVVFKALSPHIIENTINVGAEGQGVEIISVSERINFIDAGPQNKNGARALNDSIRKMEDDIARLNIKITSYEAERSILFNGESIGGVGNGVSVSEIKKASTFFQERHFELSEQIFLLARKVERLTNRVGSFRHQLGQVNNKVGKKTSEVRVTLKARSTATCALNLSYLTNKGGWAPMYDLKYNGEDQDLSFIFRANVFNATGYDWKQVNITLSTANPTNGFGIPTFDTQNASPQADNSGVEYRTVEVFNAIVEYEIDHVYNVAANSKPHLIEVEAHSMPSQFRYLVIPKLDPFGFLMAKIPNWNAYNLIPGSTNVYNKGTYMGRTFLDTYAENDTLEVFLGKDKTIQAIRQEDNKVKRSPLVGNYFTDASKVRITIKNNGSTSYRITVLDQVPIMESLDKTKFNISGISDAIYDKSEGSLTWTYNLGPASERNIDFKFDIKAPINIYESGSSYRRKFRQMQAPKF